MCIHTHTHTYIHTHTHIYTHTHTHTYIHIHTHTYTHTLSTLTPVNRKPTKEDVNPRLTHIMGTVNES